MRPSSRLLPLILLLSFGVTSAVAQSSSSGPSVSALQETARSSAETATGSSVVLKKEEESTRKAVGVRTKALRKYTEREALQLDDTPVQTVSFDLSKSSVPAPQANNGTRRLLYIIGGAIVAGGAVAGILALSGEDGAAIPPPPGRP